MVVAAAAAAGLLFSFFSTISELVERIMPAMDEAFCKAERVTLTGSTMPACDEVHVLFGQGVQALALRAGS